MAFKQMAPLKSFGPDGFDPGFYQTYQHLVGDEVTSVVVNFLNDGYFDSAINFSHIVLIPKKKNHMYANDF